MTLGLVIDPDKITVNGGDARAAAASQGSTAQDKRETNKLLPENTSMDGLPYLVANHQLGGML